MPFDPNTTIVQVQAKTYPQSWIVISGPKVGLLLKNGFWVFFFGFFTAWLLISAYVHNAFFAHNAFWVALVLVSILTFLLSVMYVRHSNRLVLTPEGFVYYSKHKRTAMKAVDYRAVDDLTTTIMPGLPRLPSVSNPRLRNSPKYSIDIYEQGRRQAWIIPDDLRRESKEILDLIANAYAKVPPQSATQGVQLNQPGIPNERADPAWNMPMQQPVQASATAGIFFHPQQILQSLVNHQVDPSWEIYPADSLPGLTSIGVIGLGLFLIGAQTLGLIPQSNSSIGSIAVDILLLVLALFVYTVLKNYNRKKLQQAQPMKQVKKGVRKRGVWLVITPLGLFLGNTKINRTMFAADFTSIATIAIDTQGRLTIGYTDGRRETVRLDQYFRPSIATQIATRISQRHQNIHRP
jgi:membrane protein implicated in regulation of membrane protease activity